MRVVRDEGAIRPDDRRLRKAEIVAELLLEPRGPALLLPHVERGRGALLLSAFGELANAVQHVACQIVIVLVDETRVQATLKRASCLGQALVNVHGCRRSQVDQVPSRDACVRRSSNMSRDPDKPVVCPVVGVKWCALRTYK
jgi:hypothetical protein